MTWVVVAFLLYMDDGVERGQFYKSGSWLDRSVCEVEARRLAMSINGAHDEIVLFSSQCIPNNDDHYPGDDET